MLDITYKFNCRKVYDKVNSLDGTLTYHVSQITQVASTQQVKEISDEANTQKVAGRP
jgi:hypothetical protein